MREATLSAEARATRAAIQAAVATAYEEAGEAIDNRTLVQEVARKTGIPLSDFARRDPVGREGTPHSLLQRTMRWHQQTLRRMGLLERERRGVWKAVGKPGSELHQILAGHSLLVFSTDLGVAVWADCRRFFDSLGEEITLTVTSPPYPLRKPRAYGNP